MQQYETDSQKTHRKPARIELQDGETIIAADHFVNEHGWVCAYVTERETGIDLRIPASNVAWIDARTCDLCGTVHARPGPGEIFCCPHGEKNEENEAKSEVDG